MGILDGLKGGKKDVELVDLQTKNVSNKLEYHGTVMKDGEARKCVVTVEKDESGNNLFNQSGDPDCAELAKDKIRQDSKL